MRAGARVVLLSVCAVLMLAAAAAALPDNRAYELVTPPEKNGADGFPVGANRHEPAFNQVFPLVAAGDGERFLFASDAAYAGGSIGSLTALVALRAAAGWQSHALVPGSAAVHPSPFVAGQPLALGAGSELDRVVFGTPYNGLYPASAPAAYVLSDVTVEGGAVSALSGETGGAQVAFAGSSSDGSRVVFGSPAALVAGAAKSGAMNLYVGEAGVKLPRLVSVLPDGLAASEGARAGGPSNYSLSSSSGEEFVVGEALAAVSGDGSRVAFTASPGPGAVPQLYLRTGAEASAGLAHTLEVSGSMDPSGRAAIAGAQFGWMTPDGAHLFFRDDGQLLAEASAAGAGLYRYDVNAAGDGGSLTLISQGLAGAMGFLGASDDGQVAYFLSEGVLHGSAAIEGQPNLYVNDHGSVSFIATLSRHDPVMLAAAANAEEGRKFFFEEAPEVFVSPAGGGVREHTVEARVSADGGRLLFQSHASLTGFDNARHPEVFEYTLGVGIVCVSCGGVEPAQGGSELSYRPATPWIEPPLNLTPDGEWAFFESDEPLVPQAASDKWNVYEYHDGRVSLLSPANGEGNARFLGASVSGRDVFFSSLSRLVGQDVDSAGDVYDARIGGGFPESQPPVECSGSECQGQPAAPFNAPSPASVTQLAGENLAPAPAVVEKAKPKPKKRKPRKGKGKARGKAGRSSVTGRYERGRRVGGGNG